MKAKLKLIAALLCLLAIILMLSLNSCSVLKTKQEFKKDSAATAKQDSGSVKKNTATNENKWFKETIYYKDGKDTIINNYFTQPVKIIRESGSSNSTHSNYDSSWKNRLDSIQVAIKESNKKKEEKTFTIWQLIGVASVCVAISFLLSKLKFSWK